MSNKNIEKELIHKLAKPVKVGALEELLTSLRGLAGYKGRSWRSLEYALYKGGILHAHTLKAVNGKEATLYSSAKVEDLSLYEIGGALTPKGYFCNLSAIYHHGLTNQIPSTVYVCPETIRVGPRDRPTQLSDVELRTAFIKPARKSNHVFSLPQGSLVLTDREKGTDFGVDIVLRDGFPCPKGFRVAGLERSLIDAVVAPHYNGGISSVLEYYAAAPKTLDIGQMIRIYEQLSFLYPFSQSIGFCLQCAGKLEAVEVWRKAFPPKQRFYIERQAKSSWAFDQEWQVHVPQGLANEH